MLFALLVVFCVVGGLAGFGVYYYSLRGKAGDPDNRQTKGPDVPPSGTTPPQEEPKKDKPTRNDPPNEEDVTKPEDPKPNPGGKPIRDPVGPPVPVVDPDPKPMKQGRLTLLSIPAQTAKQGDRVTLNVRVLREDCKGDVRIDVVPVNPDTKIKGTYAVPAESDHLEIPVNLTEGVPEGLNQVRVTVSLGTLSDSKIVDLRVEKPAAVVVKPPPDNPKPDNPKPKPENADLPADLKPIVARLKGRSADDRAKAAEELGGMGEKAMPAARALCEATLDPSQKVARGALVALEKVHPELQKPVFVLLVDEKANNHVEALTTIVGLGEAGKPAVPVLLHEIKTCLQLLTNPQARWGAPTLVQVTGKTMETMVKIAPEDPLTVKTVIDLTKFTLADTFIAVKTKNQFVRTQKPFRYSGVYLLGELAEAHAEYRKQILPALLDCLKEEVQRIGAANVNQTPPEFEATTAMDAVEEIGDSLVKCGPDAKEALTKLVVPQLKELQFHKSDVVRKRAEELRKKIEAVP
jgi:hypothetical protein